MERVSYKGYTIEIEREDCPQNPLKQWDGQVLFCLNHRRYNLHNDTVFDTADFEGWKEVKEAIEDEYSPLAILPINMYDHGGVTIKTIPFGCSWDSGQIGYAFVDTHTLKQWSFIAGDKTAIDLEQMVMDSVKLYDDYLTGNVFGYSTEDVEGDILDSCYGYYGDLGKMDMIHEAKSNIDHHLRQKAIQHAMQVKKWIKSRVPFIYRESFRQIQF